MTLNTAPTAPTDHNAPEHPATGTLPVVRVSQELLRELCDGLAEELATAPQDESRHSAVARDVLDFVLQNMPTPTPWASPDVRILPMRIELDGTAALMMGVVLSGFVHVPSLTVFLSRDLAPADFVRTALHEALHVVEALRFKALEVALMEVSRKSSVEERFRPSWLAVLNDATMSLFATPLRDDVPLDRWPLGHGGDAYVAKTAARLS